jgi:hypothetical protein
MPAPPAPVRGAAAASGELDKALFAEGVGLLVRTLGCAEQLDSQRQQADSQAQALSQALAASSRALAELERQQRLAAERAAQAQAAVEASCQANRVLVEAQGQVHQCADTVLNLLQDTRVVAQSMAELQQGVTALLARLKRPGGERTPADRNDGPTDQRAPETSPGEGDPARVKPVAMPDVTEAPLPPKAPEPAVAVSEPLEPEVDPAELAAQEARMVNGLKGLGDLLVHAETAADTPRTEPAVLEKPARAWVAADTGADAAQVLEKKPLAATVVHRRAKPMDVALGNRSSRRTLSIRAR